MKEETQSLSSQDDLTSSHLVGARLNAKALPDFPNELPATLEQAYAIQSASIKRWPDEIAGWKLGRLQEPDRLRYSAERLAGPIFRSSVRHAESGASITMPIYVGGFAAVEAEFILELGVTVAPTDKEFSQSELVDLVAAMYVGAEIASSPMAAVNQLGPTCVTSDFGNNAGLIVGPKIPNWRSRSPESLSASVMIDGALVGKANAAAIGGGPLNSLQFLIGLCARRGIELPRGIFISTGATTGIHDVQTNSKSHLDFADIGSFDVEFESMRPRL